MCVLLGWFMIFGIISVVRMFRIIIIIMILIRVKLCVVCWVRVCWWKEE